MGLYLNRPDRLVIPRWRDFKDTAVSGELSKGKKKGSPIFPQVNCNKQLLNWEQEKNIPNAIELVNSAFVCGEYKLAIEAANFILDRCKDKSHPIIKAAKLILSQNLIIPENKSSGQLFETLDTKIQIKIHEIRQRLNKYPNNAVLWIDYARWFTVIGKFDKAEKSIKNAIQLANGNAFIIRCAVRFFIHKSKYDTKENDSLSYALNLIRKNAGTKYDPWLLATEISLCSYLNKTSNLMKAGFSFIEAKNFSAFELSELTSALATVEMDHSSSKSKKLFTKSLIDPNENTIAQAQWAIHKIGELPISALSVNSYEANSYQNQIKENWEGALDEALNWLVDEPFSSSPANHASYIAGAFIDNHDISIKVCDIGLRSNPNEFSLLNNKAYSQAVKNQTTLAENAFNQIVYSNLTESEKVTYLATKGLINYRKGNIEVGSNLYDDAEKMAKNLKDNTTAFRVKIYKLRAEVICECEITDVNKSLTLLTNELNNYKKPELLLAMDNLKKQIGNIEQKRTKSENSESDIFKL